MRKNGINNRNASSFIQTLLLVSDLHRIMHLRKNSQTLADFTANREFHPAPKIYCKFIICKNSYVSIVDFVKKI